MVARPVERYDIWFAQLDPTRGQEIAKARPVVIVSRNELNRHLDTVVVCPVMSSLHPTWRGRLAMVCAGRPAEIAVDQIRTISKERLTRRMDRLEPSMTARLRRLIAEMYADG